ncbi:hypothetical protein ABZ871_25700 [Streptomyces populi]
MNESNRVASVKVKEDPGYTKLRAISDNFSNQMFALLSLSDDVIPKIENAPGDLGPLTPKIDKFTDLLTVEEREEFLGAVRWMSASLMEYVEKAESGAGAADEEMQLRIKSRNVSTAIMHVMHDAQTGIARTNHNTLRRSLLVTAVSNFEILFGKMAQVIYEVNRSALNDSDYSFTLQELAAFESLDEARQFLVERRVSALMRDSLDGWNKWLGRTVKDATMTSLPVDWPTTREVFARRNVIVHNEGKVNRIYLSLVSGDIKSENPLKVGDDLAVDGEYFAVAVQNLLALGVMLVVEIGRRLHKKHTDSLNSNLLFKAELALKRNAWHISLALSKYLQVSRLDRKQQLTTQVINWVARKELFGLDDVREELTEWDTSGLSEEFSHFRDVLLGDKEKAIKAVEGLCASGKIPLVEIAFHPAYAEIVNELPSLVARRERSSEKQGDR